MKSSLSYRLGAFALWFEYLRVAQASTDPKVIEALKSSADFYAPWGDVKEANFNVWWKTHGHLFEDRQPRQLLDGQVPDPNALLIEVPLNQSPTELTKKVKAIIQEAFDAQGPRKTKGKKHAMSEYHLTEGAEPKVTAVREMLTVYLDVYLKNKKLRGKALLNKVHEHYKSRKQVRFRKIPGSLDPVRDDFERTQRNLRRYIQNAEQVVLNVAKGEFPGDY
jgi:hypothetical protein